MTKRVLATLQLAAVIVSAPLVLTWMVRGHKGRLPTAAAPSSGSAKAIKRRPKLDSGVGQLPCCHARYRHRRADRGGACAVHDPIIPGTS